MASSIEQMQQFYRALDGIQEQERRRYHMAEELAEAARRAMEIDKGAAAAMSEAVEAARIAMKVDSSTDAAMAIERLQQQEWSRLHMMDQLEAAAASAYAGFAAQERAMLELQEAWGRKIQEAFKELPKQLRKVMEYLFERGWYLGPDISLPGIKYLAKCVDSGEHDTIEADMQEWAEGRLAQIVANVKKNVPARLSIIADAIEAHRSAKYTLSVPVLLAPNQAHYPKECKSGGCVEVPPGTQVPLTGRAARNRMRFWASRALGAGVPLRQRQSFPVTPTAERVVVVR